MTDEQNEPVTGRCLCGDIRYEYRGADNLPGASPSTFYRERFRYAFRAGIRGDLFDDFNYGLRLETATNPRSPWSTFGNNTTAGAVTPSRIRRSLSEPDRWQRASGG